MGRGGEKKRRNFEIMCEIWNLELDLEGGGVKSPRGHCDVRAWDSDKLRNVRK